MDAQAAKMIGAGLAAIGMGLAALGVGNVFAQFLAGALRNPGAADSQQPNADGSNRRSEAMMTLPGNLVELVQNSRTRTRGIDRRDGADSLRT